MASAPGCARGATLRTEVARYRPVSHRGRAGGEFGGRAGVFRIPFRGHGDAFSGGAGREESTDLTAGIAAISDASAG